MTQNTPRLGLPLIQPSQAQKHVTHNEALALLDAVSHLAVVERDAQTPPAAPSEGDIYALGAAPTGSWSAEAGNIAVFQGGGWAFVAPQNGWRLWDKSAEQLFVFSNGSWLAVAGGLQNAEGVGIQTTSDSTNRLAVASPAVLLTHDNTTGDHQLKINKALPADTASLLFQTGYSGRAEMGTTGSDDFAIKVSADGSNFTTALSIEAATGLASGAAVQQTADDTTAGRLMRADYGYGPGNLLGTVSETAGLPTGAVIESARTSNGDYVRFADGTQICSDALTLTFSASNRIETTWVFPAPFLGTPQSVSGTLNANSFLGNATPGLDEVCSMVHSNTSGLQSKISQYRLSGGTDFQVSDSAYVRVSAIGRWF